MIKIRIKNFVEVNRVMWCSLIKQKSWPCSQLECNLERKQGMKIAWSILACNLTSVTLFSIHINVGMSRKWKNKKTESFN